MLVLLGFNLGFNKGSGTKSIHAKCNIDELGFCMSFKIWLRIMEQNIFNRKALPKTIFDLLSFLFAIL